MICATAATLLALLAPSHGHVNLHGCYDVGTVTVAGKNGLTISGGTLEQTKLGKKGSRRTILELDSNKDLTWTGLTLNGAYKGKDGGPAYEADSGVVMRGDHTVTLQANVSNVQGDLADFYQSKNNALNTDITWDNSSMTDAGYRGWVFESVDGLTMENDTMSNVAVGAMDAEVDDYGTGQSHGKPIWSAEDDITISHDTFNAFGVAPWYASIQDHNGKGLQEQGVFLTDNVIDSASPLLELAGTATSDPFYRLSDFIVAGNTSSPATSTSGGSITNPYAGSAMTIQNAYDVRIGYNSLPLYDGMTGYYPNHPYLAVVYLSGSSQLNIAANDFYGALGVLHPSSAPTPAICSNNYGVKGAKSSPTCP